METFARVFMLSRPWESYVPQIYVCICIIKGYPDSAWPEALRNRKLAHPFLVALFLPGGIARSALNKCMYLEGAATPALSWLRLFFRSDSNPPAYNTPPRRNGNQGPMIRIDEDVSLNRANSLLVALPLLFRSSWRLRMPTEFSLNQSDRTSKLLAKRMSKIFKTR